MRPLPVICSDSRKFYRARILLKWKRARTHTHTRARTHTHPQTHARAHTRTTRACTRTRTHSRAHARAHTHTHIYIYIYQLRPVLHPTKSNLTPTFKYVPQKIAARFPGRPELSLLSQTSTPVPRPNQVPIQWIPSPLSLAIKRPGREAGRSHSAKNNLLKTKRNLLYIRNQSVPRCKHFPPRLQKPIS